MKKCDKCGKLYDDSFESCPNCNLIKSDMSEEDTVKAAKGCVGCLALFIIFFWAIVLIGSKLDPIEKKSTPVNHKEEAMVTFGTIPYDETDLPYLEDYINKYFVKSELQEYVFNFYIAPDVWAFNPVSGKEAIMERCAAYGLIKTNQSESNSNAALAKVHILNINNGEELGSYGLTGYKFK